MIFYTLCLNLFAFAFLGGVIEGIYLTTQEKVVVETLQITLPDFPGARDPSIFKFNDHYLLSFRLVGQTACRHCPFEQSFQAISAPQLLETRRSMGRSTSQAEETRGSFPIAASFSSL